VHELVTVNTDRINARFNYETYLHKYASVPQAAHFGYDYLLYLNEVMPVQIIIRT